MIAIKKDIVFACDFEPANQLPFKMPLYNKDHALLDKLTAARDEVRLTAKKYF